MKVLLVKGLSAYEATRVFIDEVAEAFRRRGADPTIVDVGEADNELDHVGAKIAGQTFDLAFSIGLFGELRDGNGRTLSEVAGAPHVVQYVDYPLSHYARLAQTPSSTALLVVDPSHVDAIASVYGPQRFRHVAFSPHGATGRPIDMEPSVEAFMAARPIPILFPGTFYKPVKAMWADQPKPMRRIFDTAAEIALGQEFIPALDAFDQALDEFGDHLSPPQREALRVNAFAVHEWVRQHRRFQMLKAIAKTGLPIHVFGSGYDRDLYRFRNIIYQGQRTILEIVELMGRSRAVLNVNANFGRGSHERPFTSMAAGAVAVTDYSTYYDQRFRDDEIVQLRWSTLTQDLQSLTDLMADPEALFRIASNGHARGRSEHLWDNRLDQILAAADAVRS
jgi:hypothetical protein